MLSGAIVLLLIASCSATRSGTGLTVRYFAYGSNLAKAVREKRRGLAPLSAQPGVVRDHRLAFNLPGFSFVEPAFASIAAAPGDECHGGVYELTLTDWAKLCASEGVPFGYRVVEVQVQLYEGGESVAAWTLEGNAPALVDLPPSERYMSLIRDGANELGLTPEWQARLAAVPVAPLGTRRWRT